MMFSGKEAKGFCCDELSKGGPTYSLTTWFGELLQKAENQYGLRDSRWTPLGIEFYDPPNIEPRPCIWYPGNRDHIAIRLTESARMDANEAAFQLAHEVVHLLAPFGEGAANVIEEGVATIFAHQNSTIRTNKSSYLEAERQTNELLQIDPSAIRKLREHRNRFVDFDPDFIVKMFPALSNFVAESLCKAFKRN